MPINLAPVGSDFVTEAGYDPETQTCQIRLVTSPETLYTFYGFPPAMWEAFLAAPSKASYFARNIRGKFATQKS